MTRRGRPGDYRVAIPSYQRPAVLTRKTLRTLLDGGVPADRITVFLDERDTQRDTYRQALPVGVQVQVTSTSGITAARAAALNSYPAGTPVVQFDDDVSKLVKAIDAKRTVPVADVDAFLRSMFFETAARDLWVWGLSPTPNAFYMNPGRLTAGLRFCIATTLGTFTRPGHPVQEMHVAVKEDFELSLRAWWWDGAVLRADGVAAVADHYTAGGCTETRTVAVEEASVRALEAAWPGLVRRNEKRKTGYPEIKLSPRARGVPHPVTTPPPGVRRRQEA